MFTTVNKFYFNGVELPLWSKAWGLCGYDYEQIASSYDCNAYFSDLDLFNIHCSIDHVGVVESYDWDIFCGGVRQILIYHLQNKEKTIQCIAEVLNQEHNRSDKNPSPAHIYTELSVGLETMSDLAFAQKRAFWSTCTEQELEQLHTFMRCCELPRTDPEFKEMPHIAARGIDFKIDHDFQEKILTELKCKQ